jgi:multidrug efflux pump
VLVRAEMRSAMSVAVFSGMIGVTVFGLFLTPVYYVPVRRMTGNRRLQHQPEPETSVLPPAVHPVS